MMQTITQRPSREMLQEELVEKSIHWLKTNDANMTIAKVLTACDMSYTYQIDIYKFLWNILGISKNEEVEKTLNIIKENGILFHTKIN